MAGFARELWEVVGELNAVHPFLDGNGRTIRIYAKELSKAAGFELDITRLRGKEWNEASRVAFLSANNKPLADLLTKKLRRIPEKSYLRFISLKSNGKT